MYKIYLLLTHTWNMYGYLTGLGLLFQTINDLCPPVQNNSSNAIQVKYWIKVF